MRLKRLSNNLISQDQILRLAEASSFAEALPLCINIAIEASDRELDSGGIYLLDSSSDSFKLGAATGLSGEFAECASEWGLDSARSQILLTGKSWYGNYSDLPSWSTSSLTQEGLRCLAVLPFKDQDGQVIGCFNMASHQHDAIRTEVRDNLESLASLIGRTVARIREGFHKAQISDSILTMMNSLKDMIIILDAAGNIIWVNKHTSDRLGYSMEELKKINLADLHPRENLDQAMKTFTDMLSGRRTVCDIPLLCKDGSLIYVETIAAPGEWLGAEALFGICRDVTKHYDVSREMRTRNMALEEQVSERTGHLIKRLEFQSMISNLSKHFVSGESYDKAVNLALADIGAFTHADRTYIFLLDDGAGVMNNTHEWCAPGILPQMENLQGLPQGMFPWRMKELRSKGYLVIEDVSLLHDEASEEREILQVQEIKSVVIAGFRSKTNELVGFIGLDNCISTGPWEESDTVLLGILAEIMGGCLEREEIQVNLQRTSRRLGSILSDTEALICRFTSEGILTYVNNAYCNFFGTDADDLPGRDFFSFIPEEQRREVKDSFLSLTFERPSITYEHEVVDAVGERRWQRWTDRSLFEKDGNVFEYQSLGIDITDQKKDREKMQKALLDLQNTVEATIRAMGSIIETRDPYTAGHQQRVAKLARRIAIELGLDEFRVDTVYYGSLLHDIGKMYVPSDLLTKPGKLDEYEFNLIKRHAVHGAPILKSINFPWPLWRLSAYHHERLDGSGYPYGLKGDEICLESRILAVADVMEAMTSHRPYRPGLGIEAALEELEKGWGRLYDEKVVDTCLKLFKEKSFSFADG